MNYNRQKTKYNHFFYPDVILLGLSKDIDEDEAVIYKNSPLYLYDSELYTEILKLDHRDRIIITETIKKWEKREKKDNTITGKYWDIVLDFILLLYGETSLDVAKRLEKSALADKLHIDAKVIFDNMETMRKSKGNIREQGKEIVRETCRLYNISEETVISGIGKLYWKPDNNMVKDTEQKEEGICIPLKIAVKKKNIEKKIYDFIYILINEMKTSR